jgi:protein BCP1
MATQRIKCIRGLMDYIIQKSPVGSPLAMLPDLIKGPKTSARVGLVFSERLINMPPQVVPPMYNMLLEEISQAVEQKQLNVFTHYLILSKTYLEVASQLGQDANGPRKKKQKRFNQEVFLLHAEDEVLHKHAIGYMDYEYTNQGDEGVSDSKRAFSELGIKPQGHMILLTAENFSIAVKEMSDFIGTGGGVFTKE